ncbi:MAG TPA: phosphoribosyltransferase [Candidatus Paceibacterota bacterium]
MKKHKYTWRQFDQDIHRIARRAQKLNKKFDGVWGPPRGGLPLAVCLSHTLRLPLLVKPMSKTLIVDDIADTGKTLVRFADSHVVATIFYHKQSIFEPTIWLRQKKNFWIMFPWEKS